MSIHKLDNYQRNVVEMRDHTVNVLLRGWWGRATSVSEWSVMMESLIGDLKCWPCHQIPEWAVPRIGQCFASWCPYRGPGVAQTPGRPALQTATNAIRGNSQYNIFTVRYDLVLYFKENKLHSYYNSPYALWNSVLDWLYRSQDYHAETDTEITSTFILSFRTK